ncbi:MAG: sulfur transferase domain-containing protein, partial [Nitrobacter sp.]
TVGVVAALAGGWAGYLHLTGNFHPIEAGVIYRSGQLSGSEFKDRIQENGIRTIINLPGDDTGQPSYDAEMKASKAAGVTHIDFPLSASKELTENQIAELTALLRDLSRPILMPCQGGADRSGLATALFELEVANRSAQEASAQLSFRYGHFLWLTSTTAAMDRTFERVVSGKKLTEAVD